MAEGINRVTLLGNLGADPDLRFAQSGQAVLNMRLAVTEKYKDREGAWQERTEWINCVLFGKRADALGKILRKGETILVEGSIRTTSWDKDGEKKYKTEVAANNVVLCGGKGDGAPSGGERRQGNGARGRTQKPTSDAPRNGGYGSGPRGSDGTPRGGYTDEYTMADSTGSYNPSGEDIPFIYQPSCYSMKV